MSQPKTPRSKFTLLMFSKMIENRDGEQQPLYKFKYGCLPIEIMNETIVHLENKSDDKIYKLVEETGIGGHMKVVTENGAVNYEELKKLVSLKAIQL